MRHISQETLSAFGGFIFERCHRAQDVKIFQSYHTENTTEHYDQTLFLPALEFRFDIKLCENFNRRNTEYRLSR